MKKAISVILAVVISVFAAFSVNAAEARKPMGDVDANNSVSAEDLVLLRKILMGKSEVKNKNSTDMNYDGNIDVFDLIRVKKKIAGECPKSIFNEQAEKLRNQILDNKDSLPSTVTGTVYHISANGSNNADGTEANPYSYSQFKNGIITPKKGDAVLFKRGDTFRGCIKVKTANDGTFFGAYGTGDKPILCQSAQNYAKANWTSEGGKMYSISGFTSDVGIMVFENDEIVGYKRVKKSDLKNDYDFYYNSETQTLYAVLPIAPSEYNSIEIGEKGNLMYLTGKNSNITIENLCFKYVGGHAIRIYSNGNNIKIRYCEIGFVGGSYLSDTTRYGNGIEFWMGQTNVTAEYNWIHTIYDSGLTHQGGGEYAVNGLTFKRNLVEYCGMGSIEYWLGWGVNESGEWVYRSSAQNVNYTGNILRYAGYGFGGEQRPDKVSAHILGDPANPNWFMSNFTIKSNYFDVCSNCLLNIGGTWAIKPIMSGNTYAQSEGGKFGTFYDYTSMNYDGNIATQISNFDSNAKVYWY